MEEVIKYLVSTLGLQEKQINAVLGMLSEGATIPFIARYRKDATGNLDEDQIRAIEEQYKYQENLLTRKQDVIRLIDEKGLLTEELKNELTEDKIIAIVCEYFNISRDDIVGKKKNKEIVEPRMIAIYLISEILNLPLKTIGSVFGGRDHTTIMHSRDKITQDLKSNKKTQTIINEIKGLLSV